MTLQPQPIDTSAAWASAMLAGFAQATGGAVATNDGAPARGIVCADPGFADWPLDDPALLEQLSAWLRLPGRRLTLIAAEYTECPRRLPRFCRWRRDHAHAIDAWVVPEEISPGLPTALVSDTGILIELIDRLQWRGRAAHDLRQARLWTERLDAISQRSERGFAISTLGL